MTAKRLIESRNRFQPHGLLRHISLFVALIALPVLENRAFAQAPPGLWTNQISASNSMNVDIGPYTAVDPGANVFFAGTFNAPVLTVGQQTMTNSSFASNPAGFSGTFDTYVAKYDDNGNFIWARPIGGDRDDYALATAADSSGNVLVSVISGSTNVVSGTNVLAANLSTATGAYSVVLVKFDPRGNLLWARQILGSGYAEGASLTADGNGNILLAGTSSSTNLFFGTNLLGNINLAGPGDFLAKYDPAGNLLWVKQVRLNETSRAVAAADGQGDCFLFETFTGVADFGSVQLTNSSFETVSLAKFDADGNVLWAREAAASGNYLSSARAGVDDQANCCVIGSYQADMTLQGTTLPYAGGYSDVFVAKFDATGNFVWASSIAGDFQEFAGGLAVDPMGNCYATGENDSDAVTIGGITLTQPGSVSTDGYAAKFDAAGNVLWAELLPFPTDAALDRYGNLYGSGPIFISTNNNVYISVFATKISGPVMTIQTSGSQVVISWPTNAAGLNLESTTNLPGGSWSPVTNVPVPVGSQFTVTNTLADPARYYRLRNF